MQKFFLLCLFIQLSHALHGAQLIVDLRTIDQLPMPNAVIYVSPLNPVVSAQPPKVAVMDQIDRQFSPHILVVQKDTPIRFPNSDSIKHHVYSFSPAKTFELQLYRELDAQPLLFSQSGVVELGCNIHDWMLGYVLVVDTPYFAKTNVAGQVLFNLPEGQYQLNIWHPRITQSSESLQHRFTLSGDSKQLYRLDSALLADLQQYELLPADVSEYE